MKKCFFVFAGMLLTFHCLGQPNPLLIPGAKCVSNGNLGGMALLVCHPHEIKLPDKSVIRCDDDFEKCIYFIDYYGEIYAIPCYIESREAPFRRYITTIRQAIAKMKKESEQRQRQEQLKRDEEKKKQEETKRLAAIEKAKRDKEELETFLKERDSLVHSIDRLDPKTYRMTQENVGRIIQNILKGYNQHISPGRISLTINNVISINNSMPETDVKIEGLNDPQLKTLFVDKIKEVFTAQKPYGRNVAGNWYKVATQEAYSYSVDIKDEKLMLNKRNPWGHPEELLLLSGDMTTFKTYKPDIENFINDYQEYAKLKKRFSILLNIRKIGEESQLYIQLID